MPPERGSPLVAAPDQVPARGIGRATPCGLSAGRRRILRQSWRDSPTSREPRRGLRPRLAARNKEQRIEALARARDWQLAYREARTQWLAGLEVAFPDGTYWLRRFANVRVKPPPGANA